MARERLKIGELARLTGVSKQTIHYYIREGLLPDATEKRPNMAYYSHEHVRQLRFIKHLQHEKFLPLTEIKRFIQDGRFIGSPDDLALAIALYCMGTEEGDGSLPLTQAAERTALSDSQLQQAEAAGLIHPVPGEGGPFVRAVELRVLAAIASARDAGVPVDLVIEGFKGQREHITRLARQESSVFINQVLPDPRVESPAAAYRALRAANQLFLDAAHEIALEREADRNLREIREALEVMRRTPVIPPRRPHPGLDDAQTVTTKPDSPPRERLGSARLLFWLGHPETLAKSAPLDWSAPQPACLELAALMALSLLSCDRSQEAEELTVRMEECFPQAALSICCAAFVGMRSALISPRGGAPSLVRAIRRHVALADQGLAALQQASGAPSQASLSRLLLAWTYLGTPRRMGLHKRGRQLLTTLKTDLPKWPDEQASGTELTQGFQATVTACQELEPSLNQPDQPNQP